jgi:putative copper export protein/methionine-rich copper-binding protein CopC
MKPIFGFSRHDERLNSVPRWLLRLLTSVLMTVFVSTPAHAHAVLKSSLPAAGAHVGIAPRQLRLEFSESLELTFTTIVLRGQTGAVVALGPVQGASDSRRAVLVSVRGALAAGTYTVEWKSAGADGHPVQGKFEFTIAPGAQGLGPLPAGYSPDASNDSGIARATMTHDDPTSLPMSTGFDAESPLYVAVRWLLYLGLLLVIGAFAFHHAVLPVLRRIQQSETGLNASLGHRAASVGLAGAVVVGAAVLLRLYAQSYAMHGPARVLDGGLVASMLTTTTWGRGWLLQLVGVGVAFGGFWGARRESRRAWIVAGFGVVALAFSPAFSGHAASAPQLTALAILADGLHVIGAGGWLGSLLVVLVVGIPAALRLDESERHRAVADLINAFSPTALGFAGLTAATGVFAAWIHLGQVSALWQTAYGQTLLVKLAILSVVAGTGAYNWLRVKPALGSAIGTVRIRKSARLEVAVGVLVILVTAVLVATPTAMDAAAMANMSGMTAAPENP